MKNMQPGIQSQDCKEQSSREMETLISAGLWNPYLRLGFRYNVNQDEKNRSSRWDLSDAAYSSLTASNRIRDPIPPPERDPDACCRGYISNAQRKETPKGF